jgi:phosphoribosylformylglycinamidine cyclo-ligase
MFPAQQPAATNLAGSSMAPICRPPSPAANNQLPAPRPARLHRRHHILRASEGGLSYKDAGVDIDAGNELVRRIQKMNPGIGGFSGMVPFGEPPT